MARLLYQGHGSYRIISRDGCVIYVDPYAGEGYDVPADVVLVTHEHFDHNKVDLITKRQGCRVITFKEALEGGKHNSFLVGDVAVEAVEAYNLLHSSDLCVGFIVTVDGVRIYGSGDTSKTKQMAELVERGLDYALFCGDGQFNMGTDEAAECAKLVGAKHNILIHVKPGALFDLEKVQKWNAPNKLIVQPGEEIELTP